MLLSTHVKRGAAVGCALGLAVAIALLVNGWGPDGEAMEGSMYFAFPLSMPVGLLFLASGVGNYGRTWVPFIALALPLNFLLWGASIAFLRARWPRRPLVPPSV